MFGTSRVGESNIVATGRSTETAKEQRIANEARHKTLVVYLSLDDRADPKLVQRSENASRPHGNTPGRHGNASGRRGNTSSGRPIQHWRNGAWSQGNRTYSAR